MGGGEEGRVWDRAHAPGAFGWPINYRKVRETLGFVGAKGVHAEHSSRAAAKRSTHNGATLA